MEKRALIAFILSIAVLLFYEFYFGLFRAPQTPPQEPTTETAPPPATQPPPVAPQPGALQPPPPAAPQALPQDRLTDLSRQYTSWTVQSERYAMQILAPGGRIKSFTLNDYREDVRPASPPMELITPSATGYLPLAVDSLYHPDWQLATRPFTSEAPQEISIVENQSPQPVALTTEVTDQLKLTKTFTFIPGTYVVDVGFRIQNLSEQALLDQLGISFYFEPYASSNGDSHNVSQLSFYQNGLKNLSLKEIAEEGPILQPTVDWVGYGNNYFIQAFIPVDDQGYQIVPRVLDADRGLLQVVYLTAPFQLSSGQEKTFTLRVYMGPKILDQLARAEHRLTASVDYGWFSFLAKPLMRVLEWFYSFTRNYGLAIILLTVIIKIIFWPLTHKSYQSMMVMKKIQPKIAQIREKYKDDREKLNQELMMVYRTYKVNPLGGCLPMVLQIPVFFALYRMLYGAVELRHQPFALWINDLTAPDRLHIGFPIPYLGGIPVLTLLMGLSMFVQQKMTPTGGDPRQEKIMLLMPVIFTIFFINFPSGLVLYWLVNNVLSIVQQYWINRQA